MKALPVNCCTTTNSASRRTKRLSTLLMSILFFFPIIGVISQTTGKTEGTVITQAGAPLPGASLTIKGSTVGTTTDTSGRFVINATAGQQLILSMVGYQTTEVEINNQSPFVIRLAANPNSFEDIVVIGYGTWKKAALTGAVSTVTSTEIVTAKNENVQNMLTGKVAGLGVVQNSGERVHALLTLTMAGDSTTLK